VRLKAEFHPSGILVLLEFIGTFQNKMNKRILILFTIILISGISIAREYPPLRVNWRYPIKANRVYSLDWDQDLVEEIFLISFGTKRTYLRILDPEGEVELETWIPEYHTYAATRYTAASEDMHSAYASDIDDNGNLDLFAGTWIKWTSLNVHKFYRLEREVEAGSDRTYNRLKWTYEGAGLITDIDVLIPENGSKKIVAGCLEDACVYSFTPEGAVEWKSDLDGAVWDIMLEDVDGDGLTDIVAGTFRSVSVINETGELKWSYPTNETVRGVYSADLDGDGDSEVVGASGDNIIHLLDSEGSLRKRFNLISAGIRLRSLRYDPVDKIPLLISDLDDNGEAELILASDDRILYSFNKEFGQEWNYSMSESILSLHIMEDELTEEKTLLVGTTDALYSIEMNQDYVKNREAEGHYDLAVRHYIGKNFNSMLEYATLAKNIFIDLNDTEGILKCERLLVLGQSNVTENVTDRNKKELANEYFEKAWESYEKDWLDNATRYAEKAKALYTELDFDEGIVNCDLLLKKIERRREEIRQSEKKVADEYLFKAQFNYDSRNYDDAGLYAGKAKEIYIKIDEQDKVLDCNSLIMKARKYINATGLYNKAKQHLELNQHENSSQYAKRAKELYLELIDGDMVAKCDRIINIAEKYPMAEEFYQKAEEFYNEKKYDEAIEYVRKARIVYLELNDKEGIQRCNSLLSEIEKKKSEWYMDYLIYIVAGVVILIIVLFLLVRRRSQKNTGVVRDGYEESTRAPKDEEITGIDESKKESKVSTKIVAKGKVVSKEKPNAQ